MYALFLVCALVGGTIFLLQFGLALLGAGADDLDLAHGFPHDLPHEVHGDGSAGLPTDSGDLIDQDHAHGSTWLFGVLSLRTVVAAVTFFGLAGLASLSAGARRPLTLLVALAAGAAAMYGVHYLMRLLYRLRCDGTVRIQRTLGERGTVYIPIPPHHEGLGKIQIRTQGRIMEYAARTSGPARLQTGTTVEVTEVLDATTVEVEPIDDTTVGSQVPRETP